MRAWLLVFCAISLFAVTGAAQDGVTAGVTAGSAAVKIEPLKMDFGSFPVGTSSPPMTSIVTNSGTSTLKIVDITPSGIDFSGTNTCAETLAAGASCEITVTFKPAITGTRLGVVSVMTSGSRNPSYIVLTGVGQ